MLLDQPFMPPAQQVRNGYAERAEWEVVDNDSGKHGLRKVTAVAGYRRTDPIVAMHRRSPREVTKHHLQAVEKLRDAYEIGEGVSGVGKGGGGGVGPTEARLDALAAYRAAVQAVGPGLCAILLPVALAGWTVKRWAEDRGVSENKAGGMLIGALIRLHDHYNPAVGARL